MGTRYPDNQEETALHQLTSLEMSLRNNGKHADLRKVQAGIAHIKDLEKQVRELRAILAQTAEDAHNQAHAYDDFTDHNPEDFEKCEAEQCVKARAALKAEGK